MKVSGTGPTTPTSKVGKAKKNPSSDESFGDAMAGTGAQEATGATTTQSIAKVDALLAVQAAEDPTERAAKKQARQRASTILDELDNIRMAMLNGTLTVGHMVDVADVVASHREKVMDPMMTAVMDEIDLRAQVELAKMRMALDKSKEKESV